MIATPRGIEALVGTFLPVSPSVFRLTFDVHFLGAERFPSGMRKLTDQIHALGLYVALPRHISSVLNCTAQENRNRTATTRALFLSN